MREYFFNQTEDKRMEKQNVGNWEALTKHMWDALDRKDGSLPNRELEVIDIGCHTGGMLALLQAQSTERNCKFLYAVRGLAGVEPINSAREQAEHRLPLAKFYANIKEVPSQSVDVVLGNEFLYLVGDLSTWMRELKRILRVEGGAFISLGSHNENSAWLRWRPKLEKLYDHDSYVYSPMEILQGGFDCGFEMELCRLHPVAEIQGMRYSPPQDGWGEFISAEEMLTFREKKLVFVFYPEE